MKSRWMIALVAALTAAAATTTVIALSDRGAEEAGASPDDSVPGAPSGSGDDLPDRSVTVSGHGTVEVTPDTANVSMGVQVSGQDADEVFAGIETDSNALVDTLKGLGVAEEDIRTSNLSLYPTYGNNNEITGYQGSVNVDVTVHDITRVGELLDGVRGFVGPELTLGGISFSYEDPEAVLAQARTAAIDNARVRAGQYAEAADAEVGGIIRIVESSVPTPVFARDFAMAEGAAADASIPVQPGTQELAVDVSVVFEMT